MAAAANRILEMPATTPPGEVWKSLWSAGIDVDHPAPGQSLESWLASLPAWALKKITRLADTDRQAKEDSTQPTNVRYST